MSKHQKKALVFLERGGLRNGSVPNAKIGLYHVGAATRKQGLDILAKKFGKARTFYMPNGYGNNRKTDLMYADEVVAPGEVKTIYDNLWWTRSKAQLKLANEI